jgi:hypothetical protein
MRKKSQRLRDRNVSPISNPADKAAKSTADIKRIAASLNLSPGIVAGRYQFLTQKWSTFNGLIAKFEWGKPTR